MEEVKCSICSKKIGISPHSFDRLVLFCFECENEAFSQGRF